MLTEIQKQALTNKHLNTTEPLYELCKNDEIFIDIDAYKKLYSEFILSNGEFLDKKIAHDP